MRSAVRYFGHVSVKGKGLRQGQRVGFDIRSELKGDKAINVRLAG
jgi:cold shock CspA family protein